jgi:hypothetical protein
LREHYDLKVKKRASFSRSAGRITVKFDFRGERVIQRFSRVK